MNPKKRKLSDSIVDTTPVKRASVALTGQPFVQGIENITSSDSPNVHTHVAVPMQFGKATSPKTFTLDLHASFSGKDHHSPSGTVWTQGWMDMGGETSYEKILPDALGLRQATVESRVMKRLAIGATYTPKTTSFVGEHNSIPSMRAATKNWGRTAVQSYLEDITGRTSLGLEEVGSGMRALVLAAKLRMKRSGATSEAGFRTKMRTEFPQLLTGSTTPVGGAAHYNDLIHQELTATGSSATQVSLADKVKAAHKEVKKEAKRGFKHKWQEISASRMTTTQAGKWWENEFGVGQTGAAPLTASGTPRNKYRKQYVKTKLARHGITYFKK